ncbi:helix-turn-helix transcriptional regulator, partial [Deltaproteobacteria bacterium]|nr:helix-turn-helix transcriptional regulator [Deltaproteobacteria bacterium]
MEYSENTGNWLKILIEKLNMPSTAEFCRKVDLNRGLVDKLSKGMHSPRLDTLQKIKDAFPETNMNWLISGKGNVLENVQDDDEMKLLELFRAKIKAEGNPRAIQKYFVSVEYFVQDKREMEEMEINATAQDVKDQDLMLYRMELLFLQYRRHLVSDLLNQASKGGSSITGYIPGQKEKYSELLDHLNN